MLLRHIHLPGISSYATAARLQERLVKNLLKHKAQPEVIKQPSPTIITAEFAPVYTCGRREIGFVTTEQQEFLRSEGRADFFEALRGGQTTFHGPGQLVAYPILDIKRHRLSPRCYVHALEAAVINTCQQYGISTMRTANPGVWVDDNRKICAVGVHLRRNVASHGIGLNINTDLWWFKRIVACGLEDKSVTSFAEMGVTDQTCRSVGDTFVAQITAQLHGVDGIQPITEADVKEDT